MFKNFKSFYTIKYSLNKFYISMLSTMKSNGEVCTEESNEDCKKNHEII